MPCELGLFSAPAQERWQFRSYGLLPRRPLSSLGECNLLIKLQFPGSLGPPVLLRTLGPRSTSSSASSSSVLSTKERSEST